MSNPQVSTAPRMTSLALRSGVVLAVVTAFILLMMGPRGMAYMANTLSAARLHAPRFELLATASPALKIHLATVLAAFVLATVQMIGPKGRTTHRILGWTLAVLLLTTAVASLFIRNPQGGWFNPFQLFSVWTLVGVPAATLAARAHNVRLHSRLMAGFYFGSLVFAGLLTFLPGRLLWRVLFG